VGGNDEGGHVVAPLSARAIRPTYTPRRPYRTPPKISNSRSTIKRIQIQVAMEVPPLFGAAEDLAAVADRQT